MDRHQQIDQALDRVAQKIILLKRELYLAHTRRNTLEDKAVALQRENQNLHQTIQALEARIDQLETQARSQRSLMDWRRLEMQNHELADRVAMLEEKLKAAQTAPPTRPAVPAYTSSQPAPVLPHDLRHRLDGLIREIDRSLAMLEIR